MISGAVLVGFLLGFLIQGTDIEKFQQYLDPVIVIILVILAIPQPCRILWTNLKETLLVAPSTEYQQQILDRLDLAFTDCAIEDYRARIVKMGNTINVLVHAKPMVTFEFNSFTDLDSVHQHVQDVLDQLPAKVVLDIVFVGNMAISD